MEIKIRHLSKIDIKEKIIPIYETIFRGEDPSIGNESFWSEFFLLKTNLVFLENEFKKLNKPQITSLKPILNKLFNEAVKVLSDTFLARISNALLVISSLVVNCQMISTIDDILEVRHIHSRIQTFLLHIGNILVDREDTVDLRQLSLHVLIIIVTSSMKSAKSKVLESMITCQSLYDALLTLLRDQANREKFGHDTLILLTILVQYRKYESINPFLMRLSILDDEVVLNGIAQIISNSLIAYNNRYRLKMEETRSTGAFSYFSNIVGNIFVEDSLKDESTFYNDSMLLSLYESIHLNRNFITALAQPHSNVQTTQTSKDQPGNLLVSFLEYSSIAFQNLKTDDLYNNAKLCFIILLCISEDQYANSLMHDQNMNYSVHIHRMPMRHRSIVEINESRPIACAMMNLGVEFISSHMTKQAFPGHLYSLCLDIIGKVICYQRKYQIRLNYCWNKLWTCLIHLSKFIITNENILSKNCDIVSLLIKVTDIFNLFITFGDTFLLSPNAYDELYYEIIRLQQVFESMHLLAMRHCQNKDSCTKGITFTQSLSNLRAIVNHFTPKVDSWAKENNLNSVTESQVLAVVKKNYDSLTLKLQDSLLGNDLYNEHNSDPTFFSDMVDHIANEIKEQIIQTNKLKSP